MNVYRIGICCGWVGALLVIGCGSGPTTAAIEGEVKLSTGEWLPSGAIHFVPQGIPEARTVFARIENGKYQLAAANGPAPGKHRIEITAYRQSKKGEVQEEGGKKITVYPTEQYLPARYNLDSQQSIEIVPGENRKDFLLDLK